MAAGVLPWRPSLFGCSSEVGVRYSGGLRTIELSEESNQVRIMPKNAQP